MIKLRVNSQQLQYMSSILRLPSKGPWMFETMITARDIMTSPVYTVRPTDQVTRVIPLPCTHGVCGVPVVAGKDHLVGLISE